MHQYLALLLRFRIVVAHPGVNRQREKSTVDVHLQGLDQGVLLFITIALIQIEVIIALLLARYIRLCAHRLRYVLDIARRH